MSTSQAVLAARVRGRFNSEDMNIFRAHGIDVYYDDGSDEEPITHVIESLGPVWLEFMDRCNNSEGGYEVSIDHPVDNRSPAWLEFIDRLMKPDKKDFTMCFHFEYVLGPNDKENVEYANTRGLNELTQYIDEKSGIEHVNEIRQEMGPFPNPGLALSRIIEIMQDPPAECSAAKALPSGELVGTLHLRLGNMWTLLNVYRR